MLGKTFGHYKIIEPLGEGGMGKVYRARDTKLDRDVAIKVLPDDFAKDRERTARFEREAKLLASLNHANIAAIYGLEDFDDQRFIAMELVEGDTLADRIAASGRIEIDEALAIASRIAEALEAAHESGVIHRDLKPANVMVAPDGKVKVLDFGLAKAFEVEGVGEGDQTRSPMITVDATKTGVIQGTAAYMSPEQAKGRRLDKRTDIFSFGCVLYEMLTGRRPFVGEDVSETMAAILREEPDWTVLPATMPFAAQGVLRRCLRKDPDRRLHDIADARIEIEELLSQPPDAWMVGGELAIETRERRERRRRAVSWPVAALMTIVAAWAIWGSWSSQSAPGGSTPSSLPVSRLVIPTEALLTNERVPALAISPDGTRIVYSARNGAGRQLYLREIGSLEATPIAGTDGAVGPFLSPDGERVGFAADGQLSTVSVEGGPPTTLQQVSVFLGGNWGEDNTIVYGEWPTRLLWRIPAGGGTARAFTERLADIRYYIDVAPSFVPGARAVAFNSFSAFTVPGDPIVRLKSIDSEKQAVLELTGSNVHYLPTGHLVFARGGSLLAAPFDPNGFELRSAAVAVLAGVLTNTNGAAQYDLSDTGTLIYVQGDQQLLEHRLVWVDRGGNSSPITEEIRPFWGPRLSPDGTRVATWISSDPPHLWTYDMVRGGLARLTSEGSNFWSLWTPDGQRLAFASRSEEGKNILAWQLADRSAPLQPLVGVEDEGGEQPLSWAQDGKLLIFQQEFDPETGFDLWTMSLEEEAEPQPLVTTPANEFQGILSPDGNWLAYVSDESGRREVYVKPFPGAGSTMPISTRGGVEPLWAPSGRELFYRNAGQMMVVDVETEPEFRASRPRLLFEDRYVPGNPYGSNYDIARDGERFIMIESAAAAATATQIVVVQNWFEELKRLVPTER